MHTPVPTALVKISDTNLTIAAPAVDIRGRRVLDCAGEHIGSVVNLLLDEAEQKVRFLEVTSGGLLGLNARSVLIPVDAIQHIGAKYVSLSHALEHVERAPRYDPTLVQTSDYAAIYGHYGYSPFWGQGLSYPTYPASFLRPVGEAKTPRRS